ncbi:hypothetical protein [Streptomyces europaeiscabiei]|uniref:hypothetical protein n=1 Tax=Streptomyces europaeiscabiei TaxID=146819 RepID=UPI0029A77025|nr:hypothetical protein [Streptomyces europaeiscabiei]MDX3713119.1 hypothetical protein [Streptomyces europaeiscabiei]MDX3862299.1 hypothetical protein [Streptomyces europaeiscabiei]MDX3876412.1 hypothetical protein [Streptomyces europaeiscabiei]
MSPRRDRGNGWSALRRFCVATPVRLVIRSGRVHGAGRGRARVGGCWPAAGVSEASYRWCTGREVDDEQQLARADQYPPVVRSSCVTAHGTDASAIAARKASARSRG